MPADNQTQVDIPEFLKAQGRERYRAFIVHGPPRSGKTTFARKLAEQTGGAYVDVLASVAEREAWCDTADTLDVAFVKQLSLDAAARGVDVVVVDEFDFLLPIWGGDLSQLIELVRRLSVSETSATIGFVMQSAAALETLTLTSSTGASRVLRLDKIKAI